MISGAISVNGDARGRRKPIPHSYPSHQSALAIVLFGPRETGAFQRPMSAHCEHGPFRRRAQSRLESDKFTDQVVQLAVVGQELRVGTEHT